MCRWQLGMIFLSYISLLENKLYDYSNIFYHEGLRSIISILSRMHSVLNKCEQAAMGEWSAAVSHFTQKSNLELV